MRRKHLRMLASLLRLALFGVGMTAAGTVAVWNFRPDLVDKAQDWLIRKHHGAYYTRWAAAKQAFDATPDAAEPMFAALLGDLRHVRRMDHIAEIVIDCQLRLSQLAERRGDLAQAIEWMRRCVAFDDYSVHTQARLGVLLCRQESTRSEGIDYFGKLWQRFPGSRFVAPAFVDQLISFGRPADAARLVLASDATLRSNYWTAVWDDGSGKSYEPREGTIPQLRDGELQVRFQIDTAVHSLRLMLPPFHCAALLQPRLDARIGDRTITLDLSDPAIAKLMQVRAGDDRLTTWGESGPWLEVTLPQPAPPDTMWTFRAFEVRLPSMPLVDELQRPELAAYLAAEPRPGEEELVKAVRDLRALATNNDWLQVFWRGADAEFSGERQTRTQLDTLRSPAGATFALRLPLDHGALAQLRIDFPEGAGLRYQLNRLRLVTVDGEQDLDAATMPLRGTHSIERQDGWFVVTGGDPYFVFDVPADAAAPVALVLEGEVR